jgi:uncharacterized membrane protein
MSAVWSDDQFDAVLAHVLRGGVLLSASIVACGGALFLARHGMQRPEYHVFRGESSTLRAIVGIVTEAITLGGRGLIQLGLLFLIATPIARVVLSVVGFARQRDWLYVLVTLTVLTLLTYSLTGG